MGRSVAELAAVVAPFIAEAAAAGIRPPVRLLGHDARCWPVVERGDVVVLDGYGDLWWARVTGHDARVVRELWPEERASLAGEIAAAIERLRSLGSHPAGRR